jgi:predicted nuclease with TOPRIM domain
MKLYELTDNYMQLIELADQLDEETFRNTLESIQDSIEDKVENTAKVIKSIEADVLAIKEEEKRLKERRQSLETKIDNIKDYLKEQLEKTGIDKVKRPTITVSIQNNPPKAEIVDEKTIPLTYKIPQPAKLNKKAILEAMKNGEKVPGAVLVQERGLRIK